MHNRGFPTNIYHKDNIRITVHIADAAEKHIQPVNLARFVQSFSFCENIELAAVAHLLEAIEFINTLTNGRPVSQCAAQPAVGDPGHTAAFGFGLNGVLSLALGAYKKYTAALSYKITDQGVGRLQPSERLFKINNVDFIALSEDIGRHFGVPALGTMPKVNTTL